MDRELRREWRSFTPATPANIMLWSLLSVGLLAWRLIAGDSLGEASLIAAGGLGLGIVLAPVLWLRHDRDHRASGRTTLKVFGLVLGYFALLVAAIAVVAAVTG